MPFLFVFTTLATIELFARATRIPVAVRALLFAWIALQGAIAATGFYLDEMSLPPRFLLGFLINATWGVGTLIFARTFRTV